MAKRVEGGRGDRTRVRKGRGRQFREARIVLLVEDEIRVQRVMAEVLTLGGYVVRLAATAEEALGGLDDCRVKPNLVLTDVLLPGKTGRELVCTLRARVPGIKTILVSGYGQNFACRGIESRKDVTYLPKPFSAKQLLDTVAAALADQVGGEVASERSRQQAEHLASDPSSGCKAVEPAVAPLRDNLPAQM